MSKSVKFAAQLEMKYDLTGEGDPVLILLHGYSQTKEEIRDRLKDVLASFEGRVLAISGPFLIPQVTLEGYLEGYSWYFYHAPTSTFITRMDTAIDGIKKIVETESLTDSPKLVLGYSQGGYLAPFVGEALSNVKRVIGLSCRFRHEERTKAFPFPVIAIHGEKDEIVEMGPSKSSFEQLVAMGQKGEYVVVPDEGHKITAKLSQPINRFIEV